MIYSTVIMDSIPVPTITIQNLKDELKKYMGDTKLSTSNIPQVTFEMLRIVNTLEMNDELRKMVIIEVFHQFLTDDPSRMENHNKVMDSLESSVPILLDILTKLDDREIQIRPRSSLFIINYASKFLCCFRKVIF